MAEDDKPREKLELKGKQALSDIELLAILINTGTKKKTAIDLARSILHKVGNDLNALARLSIKDLCEIDGIGPAKAITIIAAIELGGRKLKAQTDVKQGIQSSQTVYNILRNRVEDLAYEEFWLITLNRKNVIIREYKISEGGVAATYIDIKRILKIALSDLASGIILCHNHPSGNLQPSQEDIKLTEKIVQASNTVDLKVLDHLIISNKGYYSFSDEGML